MKRLLDSIEGLKKSEVKKLVDARMKEFERAGKGPSEEIFKELCFCLLNANFNAEKSIHMQNEICNGFLTLTEPRLARKLKRLGHRYPNVRANYIVAAREHKNSLKKLIQHLDEKELREWLVKNVKGLGYKTASNFLRNIGFGNSAILDFHIIDILARHKLIERPKTLTKAKYLEIETQLQKIAYKTNLSLAELDIYLWYMETGKVLK